MDQSTRACSAKKVKTQQFLDIVSRKQRDTGPSPGITLLYPPSSGTRCLPTATHQLSSPYSLTTGLDSVGWWCCSFCNSFSRPPPSIALVSWNGSGSPSKKSYAMSICLRMVRSIIRPICCPRMMASVQWLIETRLLVIKLIRFMDSLCLEFMAGLWFWG